MSTEVSKKEMPFVPFHFLINDDKKNTKDVRSEHILRLIEASKESWIVRTEIGYYIPRYDDCVAVLRNSDWHNGVIDLFALRPEASKEFIEKRKKSLLSAEGETHEKLRKIINPIFSAKRIREMTPAIRLSVANTLSQIKEVNNTEMMSLFANVIPVNVICEIMGISGEDSKWFGELASIILRSLDSYSSAINLAEMASAEEQLSDYFIHQIAERRKNKTEDIVSRLAFAIDENGKYFEPELLSTVLMSILSGGVDTVAKQMGIVMHAMAIDRISADRFVSDMQFAYGYIDSVVMSQGVIRGAVRKASKDIEYRDIAFPAGTFVFPSFASANKNKPEYGFSRHLSYGLGGHSCPGASLANVEIYESLTMLTRKFGMLKTSAEPVYTPSKTAIFGPEKLYMSSEDML